MSTTILEIECPNNEELTEVCCALLEHSDEIAGVYREKYREKYPTKFGDNMGNMDICETVLGLCCDNNKDWASQACTTKLARD